MRAKRSEKAPFTSASTRLPPQLHTAPSMNPVAEQVPTYTGRLVRKTARSGASMRCSMASMALPRCPIMGRSSARRTSAWTSVGPGRKKVSGIA